MKAKHVWFGIVAILAIVGLVDVGSAVKNLIPSDTRRPTAGIWWNEYFASVDGWNIEISESQDVGYSPNRIVHITKVGDRFTGITGHGDPLTGKWYRIFWINHNPDGGITGYNSYELHGSKWVWSPCPGDKDMTPIPQSEIPKAIARLDEAMKQRTIRNIQVVWTYNSTTDLWKGREKSQPVATTL